MEQIGRDQQTLYNGGGHPWDLSGGQDAVLLLFNHSAIAKYFDVKIGNGGVLWQQPYLLAPMETRAISIRDLIAGQIKDQDGKLLPKGLELGEIGWFNVHPAEGKGRLMQIDPASQTVAANTRVARNFSCSYVYVLCGGSINPYSVTINVGQSSGTLEAVPAVCLSATPSRCYGQASSYGGLGFTYAWGVNGPAEVNGSYTQSTATIQSTGAGTGYVNCSITLAVGDTVSVTISGSGFGSSPSVNAGKINVTISSSTDTQIVATLVIPDDEGGSQGLTVTATGQTSSAYSVFKQVFTQVQANKGSPGVDGMTVVGIKDYLKQLQCCLQVFSLTYCLHQSIRASWVFGPIRRPGRFSPFPSRLSGFTRRRR